MKLERICPICNCEKGENLYDINFAKYDGEYIPEHYNIVACENCGFIFNNTEWTQKDYDKYYISTSKYSNNFTIGAGGLSDLDRKRYNGIIDKIEKIINKDSSIVDIGCAKGGLLRIFQERGYNNLYGIEPSQEAIDNLKNYNIEGYNSSIFDIIDKVNKQFNVVILSQVLEHIYDLKTIKYIIKNILKEDGILFIDVPDGTSYLRNNLASFYYFDLEHINHFSITTLEYLFEDMTLIQKGIEYFNNFSNINSYILYGIFSNKKNNIKKRINKDITSILMMKDYIDNSKKIDFINIDNIDEDKQTFCWGLGANLRRLLSTKNYFSNIKIDGIIEKNNSYVSKKVKDINNNDIEIFPTNIIEKYNDANIIIASILYSEQIKNELLSNKNFIGKIAEQSRAEQSRAEQSRAEQSKYLIITLRK